MVNLSRIDLATEEDKQYHIDKWAALMFADINTLMCIESEAIRRIMEDGKVIVKRDPVTESEDGKVVVKKAQMLQKREEYSEIVQAEEMRMIVSTMLHKDGKNFARVSFIRGKGWAEGVVPDGVIEKSEGFAEEEIRRLENYLAREKDMLISQAKEVNPLRNMLGM